MADRLDVAARLTEGRVAVEHTQTFVQATHALGYQHPDLTAHPAQIREWYAGEDGLDLRALDRDCAELRAAAVVVAEALRMQRAQVAELAAAWTGPGGDAAAQLLQRHCDTADSVATEVRAAAQRCESLRDNLWYLVDSKVATAIAIDDRTQAQRQAWLTAAAVVTAAVGDRESAEDVVRQQVIPYVDNDIRNDWLTAMRSTSDGVQTSYAMVTDRMAGAPTACFEFPDDLGPGYPPVQPVAPAGAGPELSVDPAPTSTAAAPAPVTAAPMPAVAPVPAADWGTALGDASALPVGDLGSGLGGGGGLGGGSGLGGGGGLIGLAGRIVDAVGDLLGSASDELGDTDPLDDGDAVDEDPFRSEKAGHVEDASDVNDDKATDESVKPESEKPEPVEQAKPVEAPTPVGPPPNEAPAPGAAPAAAPEPVATPAAQPAPAANGQSTPCQIAADQLPQAGQ